MEELRLLELADQFAQFEHRAHESLVVAGIKVALRRLVQPDQRRRAKIEDEIEALARLERFALEVDRPCGVAGADAGAVRLALVEVDLVGESDRAFRADGDARIAARAQVEVDRIAALPLHVERA